MKQIGVTLSRGGFVSSRRRTPAGHWRDTFLVLDRSLDRRDCHGTCHGDRAGHTPSIGVSRCHGVPLGSF